MIREGAGDNDAVLRGLAPQFRQKTPAAWPKRRVTVISTLEAHEKRGPRVRVLVRVRRQIVILQPPVGEFLPGYEAARRRR